MTSYSNPRLDATIEDWPSGSKRVKAIFTVERVAGRGERAIRTTTGAPKVRTYATKARIVDGDDGRTYVAELASYGFVTIMNGNLKFQHEVIYKTDPRLAEVLALFDDNVLPSCEPEDQDWPD